MSGFSSLLVNCKQLNVTQEMSEWACLFSCGQRWELITVLLRPYHVPRMC